MNSDVIIGHDGKPRCAWVGAGDNDLGRYHDEVWGTRTYDESAMFEALTLGVFEVGLSWSIVFGKRDAFRKAFRGFDVAKVAAMTERDVDQLVQNASIIRNRGKIQATVDNARAMMSASPRAQVITFADGAAADFTGIMDIKLSIAFCTRRKLGESQMR